jgi:hypothetical protein
MATSATTSNRPANQTNEGYNFDDQDQFNLEAAKVTIDHPMPIQSALTSDILLWTHQRASFTNGFDPADNYIEQAYLSMKPPKAKGFEMDFGQFVTLSRPGSHRDDEQLELLARSPLHLTRFPTITLGSAPRCP